MVDVIDLRSAPVILPVGGKGFSVSKPSGDALFLNPHAQSLLADSDITGLGLRSSRLGFEPCGVQAKPLLIVTATNRLITWRPLDRTSPAKYWVTYWFTIKIQSDFW